MKRIVLYADGKDGGVSFYALTCEALGVPHYQLSHQPFVDPLEGVPTERLEQQRNEAILEGGNEDRVRWLNVFIEARNEPHDN